ILAVDGNSLGHRAFHATHRDEPSGPFVTATVLGMLATAWSYGPYDAVVVGFDHPVNRRKLEHPEYKAHRPANHPDLAGHLQALRRDLEACGFRVVEQEGVEADDLLAATADACGAVGWSCDLLTSDRDLTAVVGPTTRLLRPRASMSDLLVEDEAAVRATYGIEPWQYVDLAALRGDPSDGLKGADGVGPKIAARLLRDHGSVLGIYAALHDLHPKLEAGLRASRADVERNLVLMAPIPHLEVDVVGAVDGGCDPERVVAACADLGIPWAGARFRNAVTAPPPPPMPPPPSDPDDSYDAVIRDVTSRVRPVVATATDGEQVALF
ncbi:MAG: 5'-3' exonuclease H3TH domain-containing protein, partial [Nitriliruptor sp.]